MNIILITPDRGDRPEFLDMCIEMMARQTIKLMALALDNKKAESDKPDITQRYRRTYQRLSQSIKEVDLIFFIENDDYYSPTFIEQMVNEWMKAGQPDLFGTSYTTYYHIGLRKYFTFNHPERSSMMNTIIKPNLNINWPPDNEVFTDMFLWTREDCFNGSKAVWTPPQGLSIGIKHGVGKCGGRQHTSGLHRFSIQGGLGNEESGGRDDADLQWLSSHVKEEEILEFYKSFYQK